MTFTTHHYAHAQHRSGRGLGIRLAVLAIVAAFLTSALAAPLPAPQVDTAPAPSASATPSPSMNNGTTAALNATSGTLMGSAASGATPLASSQSRSGAVSSALRSGYAVTTFTATYARVSGGSTSWFVTTATRTYFTSRPTYTYQAGNPSRSNSISPLVIIVIVGAVIAVLIGTWYCFTKQQTKAGEAPRTPRILHTTPYTSGNTPLMQSARGSTATTATWPRGTNTARPDADVEVDPDLPVYSRELGETEVSVDTRSSDPEPPNSRPPAYGSQVDATPSQSLSTAARTDAAGTDTDTAAAPAYTSSSGGGGGGGGA